MTSPASRPCAASSALLGRERSDHLSQALERGPSGQLEHDVALGTSDHRVGAERCATLGDDGFDGHVREPDADGATAVDLAVEDERLCARPAGAGGDAAHDRDAGVLVVQMVDHGHDGETERIREQQHELRIVELRKPVEHDRILLLDDVDVKRLDARPGERGGPDREARPVLELALEPDHAFGDAAGEAGGRERLVDVGDDVGRVPDVLRAQEDEDEVRGLPAQARPGPCRRLDDCFLRRLRGREADTDPRHRRAAPAPASFPDTTWARRRLSGPRSFTAPASRRSPSDVRLR